MRLEGRKLILEETFDEIIDYITISGISNNNIYRILYNGIKYNAEFNNGKIIFKIPKKEVENTISLIVYNLNNQYLYSTNTIILSNIADNENHKIFEKECYAFQTDILNKYLSLKNLLNTEIKNINEQMNKINIDNKELINNSAKSINNKINKINDDKEYINKICDSFQKSITSLNFANENIIKNISSLKEDNSLNKNNLNDLKLIIDNLHNYDDSYLQNKIKNIEKKYEIINGNYQNLECFYDKNNYQEQIDEIINNLSNEKEKNNLIYLEIKNNLNDLKNNYDNKKIFELEDLIKKHSHTDILNKIEDRLKEIENRIKDELNKDYIFLKEKYKILLNKYQDLKREENILIINKKNKIEPFKFISSKNGEFEIYSYSSRKSPIGISDASGNIIIKGKAKVEYINNIFEGDFVYGNINGIAEHYEKGYLVLKIIDEKYCEVMI